VNFRFENRWLEINHNEFIFINDCVFGQIKTRSFALLKMNWVVQSGAKIIIFYDTQNFKGFCDKFRAEEGSIGIDLLLTFWNNDTLFINQLTNRDTIRISSN